MRVTVRLHHADNDTFYDDVVLDQLDELDGVIERAVGDNTYSHIEVFGRCQDDACQHVTQLGSLNLDVLRVAVG